mmetsp:Transcript_131436/g.340347  ORF Transcript_131436/g.340347 Transcript_131436/m.340347 type:complete len:210 (+) Transcript_131436:345-974(+)
MIAPLVHEAVPKVEVSPSVRGLVVLQAPSAAEVRVVADPSDIIQGHLPCLDDAVGAFSGPEPRVATATAASEVPPAMLALVAVARLWARTGERVPLPGDPVIIPGLTPHRETVVLPHLLAARHGALPVVEGDKGSKGGVRVVSNGLAVEHGNSISQDSGDAVLARTERHDLIVQIPHYPSQVGSIHVLERIFLVTLGAIHVESPRALDV